MSADHDPLCPSWWVGENGGRACRSCDLIARVRADERAKQPDYKWDQDEVDAIRQQGYVAGVADERQQARQRVEACMTPCEDYCCAEPNRILRKAAAAAAGGDA
jgi:hypothetical protein